MIEAAQRRDNVLAGIAAAAEAARRDPRDVALIAVSKGRDAAAIAPLLVAGQSDFGENRVREAQDKWPPLLARYPDARLHFIGRLQSNKALDAVKMFDVIHSVDRRSLIEALAEAARRAGRSPTVYVQVNIGDEEQKGGCSLAEVGELIALVRESGLPLGGLMAIPPLDLEPAPFFALLAKIAAREGISGLSMGMSGDYRQAVMFGATAVRIGSAFFEPE